MGLFSSRRPPRARGELRTFGDFLRDYHHEQDPEMPPYESRRAGESLIPSVRAAERRTFGDFRTWLAEQPLDRVDRELSSFRTGPREVDIPSPARSPVLPLGRRRTPSEVRLDRTAPGGQAQPPHQVTQVQPQLNTVARNLKVAGKASAADGRMFNPGVSSKTIYGTAFDPGFHNKMVSVSHLRSRKRREVLFAKGYARRRHSAR